ncbi:helix-turn-helix domain-containing protein [Wolbachia endosymbiont of Ctenocephalides felis wCfeT]|uniref:helix-turn-helix domain-containing protein n=1 Tax=Wolbachia endosymbiont of Ctenocephalides felis wCfeT TaxID=2732593 RepID=UPI001446636D|nr:helix-turn-helix transcriptional regulator [Wolbachia endosymbiont of Ctenocephalides felis wCfeT]
MFTEPKIGRKIKELRLIRGFSQEELGRKVGITFQQIQKYESGKNSVSIERLYAIAAALSVDFVVLLPAPPVTTELHEESSFQYNNDESDREILELVREYKEIKSQESRKAVRSLVRSLSSSQ